MKQAAERKKVVTIFGSSRPLEGDAEYKTAYQTGKRLAQEGFDICNGGYSGIMEASARGAREAGAKTIGVTFENPFKKIPNIWIDEEIFMPTLITRLMKLIEIGDAYVILKGGTGTLLELSAVWEFVNKGFIDKKPIVTVGEFWDAVVDTLRRELVWEGRGDAAKYVSCASSPEECAEFLAKRLG
jgi:uncharacterized protein (TIGR00730 family)